MAQAKKKKKFYEVSMPLIKKETQLQAYEISQLNGRIINYDLTRQLRGKSLVLQLSVIVEGNTATTIPRQTLVLPYFLRRMVRKGTNYVEDSFKSKTLDSEVTIKPFLVTRRKVSRAVRKALRNKAKEELIKYLEKETSEEIFKSILSGKLQKDLSISLKKVYPLSLCEIKSFKVDKQSKIVIPKSKEVTPEVEEEKEVKPKKVAKKTKEKLIEEKEEESEE